MNIIEMHKLFRLVGQQMGLQRVRAILPESIDGFINDAINEKVRSIVMTNTATAFPDKMSVQNNSVSPFNALRTLYCEYKCTQTNTKKFDHYEVKDAPNNVMLFTGFVVVYGSDYADYNKAAKCRIIEHDKLYNVVHDYCNAPSRDYPIVSPVINETKDFVFKVFIGEQEEKFRLYVEYIKNPAIVHYSDDESQRVDCDLPEYLHTEIVEIAVNKFFKSVGSTTQQVE